MRASGVDGALDPGDVGEIHAIFMLQQAANEDRRRHGIKRHADALAFKVLGLGDAHLAIDPDEGMAKAARREHRNRHKGAFLVGVALDDSELEYSATSNSSPPDIRSKMGRGSSMRMKLRSMPSGLTSPV